MESLDYKSKYLKYKSKYLSIKSKFISKQKATSSVVKGMNLQGGGSTENELILFKAEWCPHCKTFLTEWDKLQNELKDFKFTKVDDAEKEIIDKYNQMDFEIKGYPTLFLGKNGKYLEYMGPMDKETIVKFINSI